MSRLLSFLLVICFTLVFYSCSNRGKEELNSGIWRGVLKTKSGVEIPFNFEIIDSSGTKQVFIINGQDRFRASDVITFKDSIKVSIPLFESEIKAKILKLGLSGEWVKHLPTKDISMKFDASPNSSWRFFKANASSTNNINGRWAASIISDKDTTAAIAEFKQSGTNLTGTFLTSTGDYRFLEGTVSENKLYLSGFDGSGAYLFTGTIESDSIISDGKLYSGYSSIKNWAAKKDEKAVLPDVYSLTALKPGYKSLSFSFPDLDKKKVSLTDKKYQGKVVIVQFLGSWCPNCMDETAYLTKFYQQYKAKGVEIIGLAYERESDFLSSKKNVERLMKRYNIKYDILLTGYTSKSGDVLKSLPMLKNFMAFPTTIIIDKHGLVRKIHTGFSGPGTGSHFNAFKQDFEETINNLLNEKH